MLQNEESSEQAWNRRRRRRQRGCGGLGNPRTSHHHHHVGSTDNSMMRATVRTGEGARRGTGNETTRFPRLSRLAAVERESSRSYVRRSIRIGPRRVSPRGQFRRKRERGGPDASGRSPSQLFPFSTLRQRSRRPTEDRFLKRPGEVSASEQAWIRPRESEF